MSAWIRIPILLIAGLASAPLMEIFGVLWMRSAPVEVDLTANYFLMVVLPVALLVHFLFCLVLWKLFEPSPKVGGATYVGTHILAQASLLTSLSNPPADVAVYCLILFISGGFTQFIFHRYFWCPQCAGPPLGGGSSQG